MTEIELIKDMNLIIRYLQNMQDTQDKDELDRDFNICRKKLEEIYKDKKKLLKEKKAERKAEKKAARKEAKKEAKKND